MDVLVDLWDGQKGPWRRSLKTKEDTLIINPWINVIGATTPAWLTKNFDEVMIGGGLTSRIVFIYGAEKARYIAYPARNITKSKYEDTRKRLISDLQIIAQLIGPYEVTDEAMDWGENWYKRHWKDKAPDHLTSIRFQGWKGRKQGHVHKLALVCACARYDEPVVELCDLKMAMDMVNAVEREMGQVFASIGVGELSRNVNEMMTFIRAYPDIGYSRLWKYLITSMTPRDFEECIKAAANARFITVASIGNKRRFTAIKENEVGTR